MVNQPSPSPASVSTSRFFAGIVCLLVAIAATFMLVVQHIAGLALPGCGPGSPCALAAASVWGKVPGIGWPVSHVGLAYFIGLLIAWLQSRNGIPASFRLIARFGVLVSVLYVIVIAIEKHACIYCLVTHAAHFGFWLTLERAAKAATPSHRPALSIGGTFLVATLALAIAESQKKLSVRKEGERQLAESTSRIIEATSRQGADPPQATAVTAQPAPPKAASSKRWPAGFTGRHRLGPQAAAIRIVMLSDYQCPDCQRVERDITNLMAGRNDISLSFKHFPMCKDCNRHISSTLHQNACWAARAAETASLLRGEDGFWQMHRWLFDNRGMFDDQQLNEALASMGYDPRAFTRLMQDPQTLPGIYEDVDDGQWLGIHYTPMVFVNGVEVRSAALIPNAVPRAVEALAATNPPPMTCENDQPPPAEEKFLDDWRAQPVQLLPAPQRAWPQGGDDAKLKVAIWGDLQEPNCAKVDSIIRTFISGRTDAQYTFRHYPVDQSCNPSSQVSKHPKACLAHKAAIAAGQIGGTEAYWQMHVWLTANQLLLDEESLKQNAAKMGLDVPRFLQVMESPEVAQIIQRDGQAGRSINLTAVPTIFINGKFVPRWVREGESVLEKMLAEASR